MSLNPGDGYTFTWTTRGTNLEILRPWVGYVPPADGFECTPYKVHDVVEKTAGESTIVVYQICSATFNNMIPQVYDAKNEVWQYLNALAGDAQLVLDFASTTTSKVYLRVGPSSGGAFPPASANPSDPDDPYPRIYSTGGSLPSDSDTFGYVLVATVTNSGGVYSVDNYLTGSLWGDRLKTGTDTARYYYARI